MFTTQHIIRCDGGYRPDGSHCSTSISAGSKNAVKQNAKGLGWKTTGSWFDRVLRLHTHICPACISAARGEKAEVSR